MPQVQKAPVDPTIDPKSQTAADEAARKEKERQQHGVTATKTILTSGAGVVDDEDEGSSRKRTSLG